jgi:hypothetical protein
MPISAPAIIAFMCSNEVDGCQLWPLGTNFASASITRSPHCI